MNMQISHSPEQEPDLVPASRPASLQHVHTFARSESASRCAVVDHDPCCTEISVSPLDLVILPRGKQAYGSSKQFLTTPLVILYEESFAGDADMLGMTPPGVLTIALPLSGDADSQYFRTSARAGELLAGIGADFHVRFTGRHRHMLILLQLAKLNELLPERQLRQLASLEGANRLVLPPAVYAGVVARLRGLLQLTRDLPELLATDAGVRQLETDILDCLLQALSHTAMQGPLPASERGLRQRGFERAIALLHSLPEACDMPSIIQLSAIAGVSQRTLEYAFKERIGLSPKAFIRIRRYHHMRRLLIDPGPTVSVRDCAMRAGLFELGRVAAEYRALFGELPSRTLAISSRAGT